jgi:hypothetical protein
VIGKLSTSQPHNDTHNEPEPRAAQSPRPSLPRSPDAPYHLNERADGAHVPVAKFEHPGHTGPIPRVGKVRLEGNVVIVKHFNAQVSTHYRDAEHLEGCVTATLNAYCHRGRPVAEAFDVLGLEDPCATNLPMVIPEMLRTPSLKEDFAAGRGVQFIDTSHSHLAIKKVGDMFAVFQQNAESAVPAMVAGPYDALSAAVNTVFTYAHADNGFVIDTSTC